MSCMVCLRKSLALKHHTANKILAQELFGLSVSIVVNLFPLLGFYYIAPVVLFPGFYRLYLIIFTYLSIFV